MAQKERKRSLTYRLLLTYALIILIPVIILVSTTSILLQRERIDIISRTANAELDETVNRIEGMLEAIARIETAVRMRSDLINLIATPSTDWNDYDNIRLYIDEIDEIQRELFLVSQVDNIHVFLRNEKVPERWPVVLHERRLQECREPWDYSYSGVNIGITQTNENVNIAHTMALTHSGRRIGTIQSVINLNSFLPEIMNTGETGLQNDYAFYLSGEKAERILSDGVDISLDSVSSDVLDEAVSLSLEDGNDRGTVDFHNGHRRYVAHYYHNSSSSLLFIKFVPSESIFNTVILYSSISFVAVVIIMGIVIFVSYVQTKRNTKNLVAIMDAMRSVAKGDIDVEVPKVQAKAWDIEDARVSLVKLVDQLKKAVREMEEKQELLADTQIRAMQNQINVHFLINTVESIKMQAMMNEDNDVEHSLNTLGELFRYSLRWQERFVPLSKELEYISHYVDLMNFRNDFNVDYMAVVDPVLLEAKVPKMILQPIVENAFKYSFEIIGKDGIIIIKSENLKDKFIISVINDGTIFSDEKRLEVLDYLKEDRPEKGGKGDIGLKNIQQRLFMFYGSEYRIEINRDDEGHTVISIPIKKDDGGAHETVSGR